MQRFLDPSVLASISGLDLVAKTVVRRVRRRACTARPISASARSSPSTAPTREATICGTSIGTSSRAPSACISSAIAARPTRSSRCCSTPARRWRTARTRSTSSITRAIWRHRIAYLASQQRDAAGIIVFDDEMRNYVPPSSRQGQFARMLHAIEKAKPGTRTDFAKPFFHLPEFPAPPRHRRGRIAISTRIPEVVIKTMEPLRFHGNELILFHVLDPQEIRPKYQGAGAGARHGNRRRRSKCRRITCEHEYGGEDRRAYRRLARTGAALGHRLLPARYQQAAR